MYLLTKSCITTQKRSLVPFYRFGCPRIPALKLKSLQDRVCHKIYDILPGSEDLPLWKWILSTLSWTWNTELELMNVPLSVSVVAKLERKKFCLVCPQLVNSCQNYSAELSIAVPALPRLEGGCVNYNKWCQRYDHGGKIFPNKFVVNLSKLVNWFKIVEVMATLKLSKCILKLER